LVLAAGEAQPIRIGDPEARLGLNTWDFAGKSIGEVSALFRLETLPNRKRLPAQPDTAPTKTAHTFVDYYCRERQMLGEHVLSFVESHPNLAPLVNGPMADQGVEKLLEKTSFYNALLQEKLDDDIPELIHEVMEDIQPGSLRPIPSTTIIAFTPKAQLTQPLTVKAGAQVDSIPVQGTQCRFRSCFDITVHPVKLTSAGYIEPSGKSPVIVLKLELNQMPLSAWHGNSLRLFLSGTYRQSCDIYLLLMRYLKQIIITASGNSIRLPAENLKPFGFGDNETILTGEHGYMTGHLVVQEYYLFPEKYLFLDLHGLDKCRPLGESVSCTIEFELASTLPYKPAVGKDSFALHAVPVINLFEHKARPVLFDCRGTQSKVSVSGSKPENYRIYSVDQVSAFNKAASGKTIYSRARKQIHAQTGNTYYCLSYIQSITSNGYDIYIGLPVAQDASPGYKTNVDIELTCSNGTLAEKLGPGDVCIPASTTPESLHPSNISQVTHYASPGMQPNHQWRLFSTLMLNGTSLQTTAGVKAVLQQLALSDNRNHAVCKANLVRIEAIESIEARQSDRIISGKIRRGYEVLVKLHSANFSGPGDMYLFACAFERFLGGYVSEFCYIRLTVEDLDGSYRFEWPARFGDRSVF
jgi:type VI secretion system protein ImpG